MMRRICCRDPVTHCCEYSRRQQNLHRLPVTALTTRVVFGSAKIESQVVVSINWDEKEYTHAKSLCKLNVIRQFN